jgi:hypothetical protein
MAVLGLLPPYTLEDVKAAYRVKVLEVHPDRGGDPEDFIRLQGAYELALEHVASRGDRRAWIARQVDSHLRQEEIAAEVGRLGGVVLRESIDWLNRSFGDGFVSLADRIRLIRLHGVEAGDGFLAFLGKQPRRAPYLTELDVAGCRITDRGLGELAGYQMLRRLDVSGTSVTMQGLRALLSTLPELEWINVGGTKLSWWSRWRLRRAFPRVKIVNAGPTGVRRRRNGSSS